VARLRDLLADDHFDVVHVEHLRAGFLLTSVPPGVPRVYDSVDSISLLWERTRQASHSRVRRLIATLERLPTRAFEARLLRHADEIAVTSHDDAETLEALVPDASVTVVPNGVDLEFFDLRDEPREPRTIVFSGKMSYHANVSAVLHFVHQILPRVRQVVPDARVRIVGSNPPRVVRALATADPSIEVTGYLPDIRPAIRSATVAVCPVTVRVGIQNKILEAMALGVPVVASSEGAAGLEARAGRDLLVGHGPDEQAQHVAALLTDAALHRRIAAAGRHYVERTHRWATAAAAFEHLYQRAIARHALGVPV
jgi:glycosyltransferase involved in cell wall biosynthesis